MEEFIERRANKQSLGQRRLVQGVGTNDAWYMTKYTNREGKEIKCPYYSKWCHMLSSCYSKIYHGKCPTYVDCVVTSEWLLFSNFKSWMITQVWYGLHLDKDILVPENKIYSADTCIFVSASLNKLLTDHGRKRGVYPQGVYYDRQASKYKAQVMSGSKLKNLGRYLTVNQAEHAYCIAKAEVVTKAAYSEEALADSRLTPALLRHAAKFTDRAEELTKLINKTP